MSSQDVLLRQSGCGMVSKSRKYLPFGFKHGHIQGVAISAEYHEVHKVCMYVYVCEYVMYVCVCVCIHACMYVTNVYIVYQIKPYYT